MHRYARLAAAAALAADRQEKFQEFHSALLEEQAQLSVAKIDEIAERLELDMRKFREDVNDPAIKQLIMRDMNETTLASVRGTPAVFINGRRLKERSLEGFTVAIDAELDKGDRSF
jgi:protein-disulfide isomerase